MCPKQGPKAWQWGPSDIESAPYRGMVPYHFMIKF